jgi:hypothetical protein
MAVSDGARSMTPALPVGRETDVRWALGLQQGCSAPGTTVIGASATEENSSLEP